MQKGDNVSTCLMADKKNVKTLYYSVISKLDTRIKTWQKYGTNKHPFNQWIYNKLGLSKCANGKLIDVGCGTGDFLNFIQNNNNNLILCGMDLSDEMIKKTKSNFLHDKDNFVVADAEKIPFGDNSFDFVLAAHLLHHTPDIRTVLRELYRVLKKGGSLLVVTGDYKVDLGLNKIHYKFLKEFDFPSFMLDKENYLRFNDRNAINYLNDLHFDFERYVYVNDLNFVDAEPALSYYKSAMMFRNSFGFDDNRIESNKWESLSKAVESEVKKIIFKDGQFKHSGLVCAYKIIK